MILKLCHQIRMKSSQLIQFKKHSKYGMNSLMFFHGPEFLLNLNVWLNQINGNVTVRRNLCTDLSNQANGIGTNKKEAPLKGVRVVDLTRVLAGPFATMVMGDLGAEIIKIERPGIGDDTRRWGPPFMGPESLYFLSINRNKKSICVDLKNPKGAEIVKQLVKESDVLIENYLPGKLGEMGLGYGDIHAVAPHVVYCSITGYGQTGPYAKRAGYDVVAAAMSGLMHITGPEDGEPCRVGVAMTDLATGQSAVSSILAALLLKQRSGVGQHIDCNLLSTQVAVNSHIAANWLNAGIEAQRRGTGHPSIVPYQAFKTSDGGYIIIGAGNDEHFKALCQRLERSDLSCDERYTSNERRVKHRADLIATLSHVFELRSLSEWLSVLEGCGFPYGPINNMQQAFEDPQVVHNEMIQTFKHPTAGQVRVSGPPVRFSDYDTPLSHPPPTLGQHTNEVLSRMLNMSEDELASLHSAGVIS